MQVRAEHEEKSDAGDSKRRLYIRQYSLPKGVDVEHIRPTLTKDGVLTVEAAAPTLSSTERMIPIEYKSQWGAAEDEQSASVPNAIVISSANIWNLLSSSRALAEQADVQVTFACYV